MFREVGAPVDSALAWARYMVLDGGAGDTARCVTLQYVEDEAGSSGFGGQGRGTRDALGGAPAGVQLLSVDVAAAGTGAFGDDLAIECLATAYGCNIFVVRAMAAC